jgi:hypothetical protein
VRTHVCHAQTTRVGTNPGSQPHRNVHIRKANEAATCHLLC